MSIAEAERELKDRMAEIVGCLSFMTEPGYGRKKLYGNTLQEGSIMRSIIIAILAVLLAASPGYAGKPKTRPRKGGRKR